MSEIDVDQVCRDAAHVVHKNYSKFIDREDLEQEASFWCYDNDLTVQHLVAENDEGSLYHALFRHLETVAGEAQAELTRNTPSGLLMRDDGPGSRRVLSNRAAQELTETDY